jgi:mannosyl-3-phosphoglycerate phosphatase
MTASNEHRIDTLIFSDLDGTLLDHYDYSFKAASVSLERLCQQHIPVILNTSKTAAEVLRLQQALHLDTPFIVENGAAIFIPRTTFPEQPASSRRQGKYYVIELAPGRERWIKLAKALADEFAGEFESFSDMSLARISEVTGLSAQDAELSAQRLYGEPLLWLSSSQRRDEFVKCAKGWGASPLIGGRFLHLCGDTNKGKALIHLSNEYRQQFRLDALTTIALGDGDNDVAMLEAADIAVRILSPVNPPPQLSGYNKVFTSTQYGPSGWQEIIDQLLPPTHNK